MKDRLLTLLKITISLGLIVYVFGQPTIREADWGAMLANVRTWPWLVALAIYFGAIGLNVLKWQYLLATLGIKVPYLSLFRHNLVGLFFANLPLSMVGGDIARGWDLARHVEGRRAIVAVSVLVDRLVGLAAFLFSALVWLAYAVYGLDRPDLSWLLVTMLALFVAFAVAFAVLMSQRLRGLVGRLLAVGPLARLLPLYRNLSDAVQGYRTRFDALLVAFVIGLATVVATCIVNFLAAVTVGADVPLVWVFVLTPLTPFALYIPSIASGLGVNQAVFVALYHNLTGLLSQAPALGMSLVMQLTIYVASLPGAVLWWRRRDTASTVDRVPGTVE